MQTKRRNHPNPYAKTWEGGEELFCGFLPLPAHPCTKHLVNAFPFGCPYNDPRPPEQTPNRNASPGSNHQTKAQPRWRIQRAYIQSLERPDGCAGRLTGAMVVSSPITSILSITCALPFAPVNLSKTRWPCMRVFGRDGCRVVRLGMG